ncbi:ATP-binding protein [Nitratidesulfovibrio sp.]|uniref:ATP-binding protein n=1 Tax=Nitratidesulfovibrio sp. TaxID=2802297 RepID=UPI0033408297
MINHKVTFDESKLSWADYQQRVIDALKKENYSLFDEGRVYVSNEEFSGIADIEIRCNIPKLRVGGKTSKNNDIIIAAIECKRRSRTLSLDVVGKIFCYAILNRPHNLFIVSPKPLSAQAKMYAERLFGSSHVRGNFDHTQFHNMTLGQLLARRKSEEKEEAGEIRIEQLIVRIEHNWGVEIVADDSFMPDQIEVPVGARVVFDIVVSGMSGANLFLAIADAAEQPLGSFRAGPLEPSLPVCLDLSTGRNVTVAGVLAKVGVADSTFLPTDMIRFITAGSAEPFGDLRNSEAQHFAQSQARHGSARVVAIHGEAGVGKSHFCESVARQLKDDFNYDCFQAIATETAGSDLFARILKARLFSNVRDRRTQSAETEYELAEAAVAQFANGVEACDDIANALKRATDGQATTSDGLAILDSLTHAIRHCPRPLLIVLRNCHHFPPATIRMLRELFLRLHAEGWGSTHFLLEYRDTDRRENPAWDNALVQCANELGYAFKYHPVVPLTCAEVEHRVCAHIECPEASDIAITLVRMTGGNPMFLEHVVRQFIDDGIIIPGDRKRYRVDHMDIFKRRIENVPHTIEDFLSFRIGEVVNRAEHRLRPVIKAYLGLSALSLSSRTSDVTSLDEARIAKALHVRPVTLERIRSRVLGGGVMKSSLAAPPAVFSHDMMAASALAVVRKDSSFRDYGLNYLNLLDSRAIDDAVIGGRLSSVLDRPADALMHFERGARLSADEGSFIHQRRCLEGVCQIFADQEAAGDAINYAAFVQSQMDFLWNEIQRGSQYVAERMLNGLKSRFQADETNGLERATVAREAMGILARYRLILDLRQGLARSFVEDFEAFLNFEPRGPALAAGLTRLLLLATHTCNPVQAVKVLELVYANGNPFEGQSEEAQSSFLSDVGHLFLLQEPMVTQRLWEDGVTLAARCLVRQTIEGYRQWAHSRTNALIVRAILQPDETRCDELEVFMAHLKEKGITNPLIRLINCYAALLLHGGRFLEAKAQFMAGLSLARSTSSRQFEWLFCHNLAITALMEGEQGQASAFLSDSIRASEDLLSGIGMGARINRLISRLQTIAPQHDAETQLPVSSDERHGLRICGTLTRLARTYRLFRCLHVGSVEASPDLDAWPDVENTSSLLEVRAAGGLFILAVE